MRCGWVRSAIITLFISIAGGAWAADVEVPKQTPHQVIESVTNQLIETIAVHRDTFAENPESFFEALDSLLGEAIDFNWIAYRVMGSYGKQATAEQRTQFASTFRCELIETYGRGLIAYGDQAIVLLPPTEDISGKRRVTVTQEIRGDDGVFPLTYSMGLNGDGQWKVTNMVMNGINLGKTFRNQFLQRAQKFDGNIDQIIDNWSPKG
ncbi:MAG: ABC transporter substrate-binding protein [Porticoccus sp.]